MGYFYIVRDVPVKLYVSYPTLHALQILVFFPGLNTRLHMVKHVLVYI